MNKETKKEQRRKNNQLKKKIKSDISRFAYITSVTHVESRAMYIVQCTHTHHIISNVPHEIEKNKENEKNRWDYFRKIHTLTLSKERKKETKRVEKKPKNFILS